MSTPTGSPSARTPAVDCVVAKARKILTSSFSSSMSRYLPTLVGSRALPLEESCCSVILTPSRVERAHQLKLSTVTDGIMVYVDDGDEDVNGTARRRWWPPPRSSASQPQPSSFCSTMRSSGLSEAFMRPKIGSSSIRVNRFRLVLSVC